ncbi:MAG TPA: YigZ family protein [Ignavibacteriaceae bacterium]|nr:YigZ family protein [Ignavibacteriaceae bacterium]
MLLTDYNTVFEFHEHKIKEKGSTFISQVFPAANLEECNKILTDVRKKYYDAVHHCYAYKLLDTFKYSDDGEPNGTAGIRIYNAIEHFNLHNVIIIVVRYFGGVKLGVGPLGKVYYQSAYNVLEEGKKITKLGYAVINVEADFNLVNVIYNIISTKGYKIADTQYKENAAVLKVYVPVKEKESALNIFNEIYGAIVIEEEGVVYL